MRKWPLYIALLVSVSAFSWRPVVADPQAENKKLADDGMLRIMYPGLQIGDTITLFLTTQSNNSPVEVSGVLETFDGNQFRLAQMMPDFENPQGNIAPLKKNGMTVYVPRSSVLYLAKINKTQDPATRP